MRICTPRVPWERCTGVSREDYELGRAVSGKPNPSSSTMVFSTVPSQGLPVSPGPVPSHNAPVGSNGGLMPNIQPSKPSSTVVVSIANIPATTIVASTSTVAVAALVTVATSINEPVSLSVVALGSAIPSTVIAVPGQGGAVSLDAPLASATSLISPTASLVAIPGLIGSTDSTPTSIPADEILSIYASYTSAASASLESAASIAAASITSMLLSESQAELVTTLPNGMTTTFEIGSLLSASSASATDAGPPPVPFWQDKSAVIAVFSIVGVIGAAVIVMIVTAIYRQRRSKRLEAESDEAAAAAAADADNVPQPPIFAPDYSNERDQDFASSIPDAVLPFAVKHGSSKGTFTRGSRFPRSEFLQENDGPGASFSAPMMFPPNPPGTAPSVQGSATGVGNGDTLLPTALRYRGNSALGVEEEDMHHSKVLEMDRDDSLSVYSRQTSAKDTMSRDHSTRSSDTYDE